MALRARCDRPRRALLSWRSLSAFDAAAADFEGDDNQHCEAEQAHHASWHKVQCFGKAKGEKAIEEEGEQQRGVLREDFSFCNRVGRNGERDAKYKSGNQGGRTPCF